MRTRAASWIAQKTEEEAARIGSEPDPRSFGAQYFLPYSERYLYDQLSHFYILCYQYTQSPNDYKAAEDYKQMAKQIQERFRLP